MGNYEQLKQAVSSVIKNNGNMEITGDILQNTLLSIISTVGGNATFAGIATPETNPGTPDQNVFYIASQNGTYSNFGGITLENKVVIFSNVNGSWKMANTGIATEQEIIYDVSARNNNAVFESLQALLSSSNLNTLIPASVRCGGMSIRFIQGSAQNSNNEYAQYRLLSNIFSTNEDDWEKTSFTYSEGGEVQQVNVVVSMYIDKDGVYQPATSVYKATEEYIEVQPDRSYESNCVYDSYCCTAFYDKDKNFLSYTQDRTFKIPNNCKHIRLSSIGGGGISLKLLKINLKEQIQNISVNLLQEAEHISTIDTYIHDSKEYISKYLSLAHKGVILNNGDAYISNIDGLRSLCLIPIKVGMKYSLHEETYGNFYLFDENIINDIKNDKYQTEPIPSFRGYEINRDYISIDETIKYIGIDINTGDKKAYYTFEPIDINNYSLSEINCYGDSQTAGGYTNEITSWVDILASKIGYTLNKNGFHKNINNFGNGGENCTEIAIRQGAIGAHISPFTLLNTGLTSCQVLADNGMPIPRLGLIWNNFDPVSINGIICNLVNSNGNFAIQRKVPSGSNFTIARPCRLIPAWAGKKKNTIQIIMMGQNGGFDGKKEVYFQIIDSMISDISSGKFLIVSPYTKSWYSDVDSIESEMAIKYGIHYLNLRKYMLDYGLADNNLTETEEDIERKAQGLVSKQLEYEVQIHPNQYGFKAIANCIYQKLQDLQYI